MEKIYTVKNFRVFSEEGVTIDFKPITIFTGTNCSGKSSLVKAVCLTDSFLNAIKLDLLNGKKIKLSDYRLDFSKYPNNLLGNFESVIHRKSKSQKIIIEYTVYSLMMSKDVTVQLVFGTREEDEEKNGYLEKITMEADNCIFFSIKDSKKKINIFELADKEDDEDEIINLNVLSDACIDFLQIEYNIHNYCGLYAAYDIEGDITREDFEEQSEAYKEWLRNRGKSRVSDILKYVRTTNKKSSIIHRCETDASITEWSKKNDSFFFIPILDELEKVSDDDIRSFIQSNFVNDNYELQLATDKIMDDYLRLNKNSFKKYFRESEVEHFEYVKRKGIVRNFSIIEPNELSLKQNYLASYPGNRESVNLEMIHSEDPKEEQNLRRSDIKRWMNREITFDMLYEIVMAWNKSFNKNENEYYKYVAPSPDNPKGYAVHYMYNLLSVYVSDVIQEVLAFDWNHNINYVSSARAIVRRFYTLDTNDDFANTLQRYFEKKNEYLYNLKKGNQTKNYIPDTFLNRWIKELEIGEWVDIKKVDDGIYKILLHKSKSDRKGTVLADEGYGVTQLISILLQIETTILSEEKSKLNEYYGLSDLKEFATDEIYYERKTIAIEEPEIHFHPALQSKLTEMFYEAYKNYKIHFIIETHSEYLVRNSQVIVKGIYASKDNAKEKNPFSVYYFRRNGIPYDMRYSPEGNFERKFGEGFFNEAGRLHMHLLTD